MKKNPKKNLRKKNQKKNLKKKNQKKSRKLKRLSKKKLNLQVALKLLAIYLNDRQTLPSLHSAWYAQKWLTAC